MQHSPCLRLFLYPPLLKVTYCQNNPTRLVHYSADYSTRYRQTQQYTMISDSKRWPCGLIVSADKYPAEVGARTITCCSDTDKRELTLVHIV